MQCSSTSVGLAQAPPKNKSYETDTTNRLLEDGLRDESSGYNPVYDLKECSSQRRYGPLHDNKIVQPKMAPARRAEKFYNVQKIMQCLNI